MVQLEEKKIFLIASSISTRTELYSHVINKHYANSTIFTSNDGTDSYFKLDNVPPHVLIVDQFLPKQSGIELTEKVLKNEKYKDVSIIIIADVADKEHFVDEVVLGRVQFFLDIHSEAKLNMAIAKSLNFLTSGNQQEYRLKFLTANDILFREGDQAPSVYILKRGELQAYKGDDLAPTVLGNIAIGEFVGEMAHINGENRSATVKALTDCELIEIPRGTLDMVLFSKPAWSKALVSTLSKRLRRTNNALSKNES
jgi:CRP/FNR family cyclic AMP-dependent transcriptional regulator